VASHFSVLMEREYDFNAFNIVLGMRIIREKCYTYFSVFTLKYILFDETVKITNELVST
jgi:hypothetical protein